MIPTKYIQTVLSVEPQRHNPTTSQPYLAFSQSDQDLPGRRAGLKLWAFVTLGLYFIAAVAIYVPLVFFCFWRSGEQGDWGDVAESFTLWWFWLILGVFLLAQVLLLVVPVRAAWDYQIKPRRLCVPIATTCMLLAFLVAGIILSELMLLLKHHFAPFFLIGTWLAVVSVSWLAWWIVFRKYTRTSPDEVVDVTRRWLMRGSIVELLVAIGCHIWVRRRGDCSSPAVTFIAICAGFATMLCAFGPGVFHLLVARARRMRSKARRDAARG